VYRRLSAARSAQAIFSCIIRTFLKAGFDCSTASSQAREIGKLCPSAKEKPKAADW